MSSSIENIYIALKSHYIRHGKGRLVVRN